MSKATELLEKLDTVAECKNWGKKLTSADGKVSGKIKGYNKGEYTIATDNGDVKVPEEGSKVE